jgi:type I restriction-modification system DNA methylase subunit
MSSQQISSLVSFIWGIADDCLRDVYVRGKYRDVILPMTVVRRLDAVLEPTKKAVLEMKARLDAAGVSHQAQALCQAAGEAFCDDLHALRCEECAQDALEGELLGGLLRRAVGQVRVKRLQADKELRPVRMQQDFPQICLQA